MRIAFYAPLKPPTHATPSGDRAMAGLLMDALACAGHEVRLASSFASFSPVPDAAVLRQRTLQADDEIERLAAFFADPASSPDLWFTYHVHYKAPDLLGPALARHLAIPYVTAEASHAAKRSAGPWAPWQAHVETGLRAADLHICFTPGDYAGLAAWLGTKTRLAMLPPFVDVSRFGVRQDQPKERVELVAVAMMRSGVKTASYAFLAEALQRVRAGRWRLTIVGDGPARAKVEAAFADFPPGAIVFAGALAPDSVAARLAASDIFVWPGIGEAYGMAYLEAQAAGLPVVALRNGGVAETLVADVTGFLVASDRPDAYAAAVERLVSDAALRRRMAAAAVRFAHGERSLQRAAGQLGAILASIHLGGTEAAHG